MNQDNYKKKWFAIPAGVIRSGRRSSGILFLLVSCITAAWSQRGGEQVFEFVKLPTSARATALGGSQIAATTNDYGLVGGNPGMLNSSMDNSFVFQHNFHFAGIGNGFNHFILASNSTLSFAPSVCTPPFQLSLVTAGYPSTIFPFT